MMGVKSKFDKDQMYMVSANDLVSKNHLVRKLDEAIDLDFIYDLVRPLDSKEGRESICRWKRVARIKIYKKAM